MIHVGDEVANLKSLLFTGNRQLFNGFYPRRYLTTASVREWTCNFSYTVRT